MLGDARAQTRSPGRDTARLPSSFFTMSNSPPRGCRAAHLVPAAHFLRPGCRVVVLCPPHLRCLGRRFGGARAQILGVSCSSDPEMRGRRSAGRRTTLVRRAGKTRPHACEACPSRATGTSASRRSTVALPEAPLRLRHFRRSRGKAGSPTIVHGRLRTPGSTAVTSRGRRHTPLRLSGSSPETPLMSEDEESCTIYSLRSQDINANCSRTGQGPIPDDRKRRHAVIMLQLTGHTADIGDRLYLPTVPSRTCR